MFTSHKEGTLPSGILSPPRSSNTSVEDSRTFSDIEEMVGGTYCRLYKARRQGQWWVLKSLKEENEGQPFYEQLLAKEYEVLTRLQQYADIQEIRLGTKRRRE